MSLKTLPFVVFNLGGEMLYVLRQRLTAQKIPTDRAAKVLADLIRTMFHKQFVEELFRPQEIYTIEGTFGIFDKICHASIMRLNDSSMHKLYDLMLMSFKQQLVSAAYAHELVGITLNHLDEIREMCSEESTRDLIDYALKLFVNGYGKMPIGNMQLIQRTLFSWLQDKHTRVSLFLALKLQSKDGRFIVDHTGPVPPHVKIPGLISVLADDDVPRTQFFTSTASESPRNPPSLASRGNRGTELGKDLFKMEVGELQAENEDLSTNDKAHTAVPEPSKRRNAGETAQKGLDLLSHLLGSAETAKDTEGFKLSLFDNVEGESSGRPISRLANDMNTITIDTGKGQRSKALQNVAADLDDKNDSKTSHHAPPAPSFGEDLLDLMDLAQ